MLWKQKRVTILERREPARGVQRTRRANKKSSDTRVTFTVKSISL